MRSPFWLIVISSFVLILLARVFLVFTIKFWFLALPLFVYLGYKIYKLKKFIGAATQQSKFAQSHGESGDGRVNLDPDKQVKGASFKVMK